MDPKTHHALLVAINRYPGLSDLRGPENDAAALAAWLKGPGGLDAERVKIIKSSDFAAVADPYDANPTDSQIKKQLNAWLKDAQGNWHERVGERLYLFFAGHGFTAGSLTDPALFTAQAQLDDRAHIAAYRYAAKIANAGFFDEIVLLMDCCQDVLKASAVTEPSWSPPDRSASGRVKTMLAFGAPRGHKAFEDPPPPAGAAAAPPVHGYFSSLFLEALDTAPADALGQVSARSVEEHFSGLWKLRYLPKVNYEPPFQAPRDMVLYVRPPAALAPAARSVPPPAAAPLPTAPAAAARGSARSAGPAPREVNIELPDLGAQIHIVDDLRHRIVARSARSMRLKLPPGSYRAQVQMGGVLHEEPFVVEPRAVSRNSLGGGRAPAASTQVELRLPQIEFASPTPAGWSRSHHEYHLGPCGNLLDRAGERARQHPPTPATEATLFVFARDSAHPIGKPWKMAPALRAALRLRRLGAAGAQAPVGVTFEANEREGWCSFTQALPSGTWLLGARRRLREHWIWDELVIEVAPNWRTEVYFDCIDDAQDGRRYDVDNAALRVVPREAGDRLADDAWRRTELLRVALAAARAAAPDDVPMPAVDPDELGPMGTLYAAALETFERRPDIERLRAQLQWLRERWSARAADLALLQRWSDVQAAPRASPAPLVLADDAVPSLERNWALLGDPALAAALAPAMQRRIAPWRTVGGTQVQMQHPEVDQAALPRNVAPLPTAGGAPDLARIAAVLGRPDPFASPLHQSLRSALIDARDEPAPALERAAADVARAAGIGAEALRDVLEDLWECAAPVQAQVSA